MKEIYAEEKELVLRTAHDNDEIKFLYENYLHDPNNTAAHAWRHTHYSPKTRVL